MKYFQIIYGLHHFKLKIFLVYLINVRTTISLSWCCLLDKLKLAIVSCLENMVWSIGYHFITVYLLLSREMTNTLNVDKQISRSIFGEAKVFGAWLTFLHFKLITFLPYTNGEISQNLALFNCSWITKHTNSLKF